MANTSMFTTYDQVGLAESVDDVISNLTPADTPFYSSIKSESINARLIEWQEDSLADPVDNAAAEGADAVDGALTPTLMRSNNTQIFTKAFKISKTSDAVKTYGRARETAYQLGKKLKEIKKDVEYAMVGRASQAAVLGADEEATRRFANVWAQIDAGNIVVTDADAGTGGDQAGPLTEANILKAGQKLYEEGADATTLMIKPSDSLLVANFAAAAGRSRDFAKGKEVVNVVNLYVSPFGEYKVVINREINPTYALLYTPSMWKTGVLRGFTRELLAKTGDADRHFIVGELTLKHMNFKGTAAISNLT